MLLHFIDPFLESAQFFDFFRNLHFTSFCGADDDSLQYIYHLLLNNQTTETVSLRPPIGGHTFNMLVSIKFDIIFVLPEFPSLSFTMMCPFIFLKNLYYCLNCFANPVEKNFLQMLNNLLGREVKIDIKRLF